MVQMDTRVWVFWEYDSMWYLGTVIQTHDGWHTIEFDNGFVETLELAKLGVEDWFVAEPDSMPIHQLSAAPDDDDDASSSSRDDGRGECPPRLSFRSIDRPDFVFLEKTQARNYCSSSSGELRFRSPQGRLKHRGVFCAATGTGELDLALSSEPSGVPVEAGASSTNPAASRAAPIEDSSTVKAPSASPEALSPSTERATPRVTAVTALSSLSAKRRSPPDDVYKSSSSREVVPSPPKAPAVPRSVTTAAPPPSLPPPRATPPAAAPLPAPPAAAARPRLDPASSKSFSPRAPPHPLQRPPPPPASPSTAPSQPPPSVIPTEHSSSSSAHSASAPPTPDAITADQRDRLERNKQRALEMCAQKVATTDELRARAALNRERALQIRAAKAEGARRGSDSSLSPHSREADDGCGECPQRRSYRFVRSLSLGRATQSFLDDDSHSASFSASPQARAWMIWRSPPSCLTQPRRQCSLTP